MVMVVMVETPASILVVLVGVLLIMDWVGVILLGRVGVIRLGRVLRRQRTRRLLVGKVPQLVLIQLQRKGGIPTQRLPLPATSLRRSQSSSCSVWAGVSLLVCGQDPSQGLVVDVYTRR